MLEERIYASILRGYAGQNVYFMCLIIL